MTRRFPFGLTVAVLIALAILIGLGAWQLQRREWKEELLARRAAAETATPRPLVPALASASNPDVLDGIKVEAVCPGLAQAPYVQLYGVAESQMVARLVSPCPLEGSLYDAILVDRGYVLLDNPQRPQVIEGDAYPIPIVGVLMSPAKTRSSREVDFPGTLPPETQGAKLWMGRDLAGMATALGVAKPAPYFLAAQTSTNPDWEALRPGLPPAVIPNNHLQYALTWFALAGVLVAIYAAMLRKRLKS